MNIKQQQLNIQFLTYYRMQVQTDAADLSALIGTNLHPYLKQYIERHTIKYQLQWLNSIKTQ